MFSPSRDQTTFLKLTADPTSREFYKKFDRYRKNEHERALQS